MSDVNFSTISDDELKRLQRIEDAARELLSIDEIWNGMLPGEYDGLVDALKVAKA